MSPRIGDLVTVEAGRPVSQNAPRHAMAELSSNAGTASQAVLLLRRIDALVLDR